VILDARAQQPVEILARDQQVLELVEHHQRRHPVVLPQREREIEQPVEHRFGRRGIRGPRAHRERDPGAGR
jgi:hypothetical protein